MCELYESRFATSRKCNTSGNPIRPITVYRRVSHLLSRHDLSLTATVIIYIHAYTYHIYTYTCIGVTIHTPHYQRFVHTHACTTSSWLYCVYPVPPDDPGVYIMCGESPPDRTREFGRERKRQRRVQCCCRFVIRHTGRASGLEPDRIFRKTISYGRGKRRRPAETLPKAAREKNAP